MSADSMISAATVTHAGVLHTCKYGFANFGIWLLAVTFCYWCWCAWSLADQLNSLLGNTVTNQPAFLATRWPIDNLLPLTLFSGTAGWRRGGWTRFSWMLPCLLLGTRSPTFHSSSFWNVLWTPYQIILDRHWPAGRGEGNGKNKASENEGKTGHSQCLFVIIIIIVYYFLFWNRLEHKWEEQDKSVWRQDRPQSEPVVHLMQTMSIENINSKKTRQRPTTKNENIWQ